MTSTRPRGTCFQPSQVVLGTTEDPDSRPGSSQVGGTRLRPPRNNVAYLAGREARDSLTVKASFDQVCILSPKQRFDQALPFCDAFPGSQNTDQCITCIAVGLSAERDQIFLAASMDHRIAIWHAPVSSFNSSRKWRVHSTLTINDGVVTTLDIVNAQLLIGNSASLTLWRLDSFDIPIWRRFWTKLVPAAVSIARFSPDATTIAAVVEHGQHVLLFQYQPRASKPPILQQRLYHARPVTDLVWRQPPEPTSQADVLVTYASDGIARLWAPVIDEPTQLRLWSSIQAPHSVNTGNVPAAFHLDPHIACAALRANIGALQREIQMAELGVGSSTDLDAHTLELDMDLKRTRLRRLEQLLNETPDMFVSFEQDGHLSMTAVANVDRRPPTLLQALTVLRIPFALPRQANNIRSAKALPLHAPPGASSTVPMLTLYVEVEQGESIAYAINPATFFDGRGLGIEPDTCHPCGPPSSHVSSSAGERRHTSRVELLHRSGNGKTLLSSSARQSVLWTSDASTTRPEGHLHFQASTPSFTHTALSWNGSLTVRLFSDGKGEVSRSSDTANAHFKCDGDVIRLLISSLGGNNVVLAVTTNGAVHSWMVEEADVLRLLPNPTSHLWSDDGLERRLVSVDSPIEPAHLGKADLDVVTVDTHGHVNVWNAALGESSQLRWSVTAAFYEISGRPLLVRCNAGGLCAIVCRHDQQKQTLVVFDSKTTSFSSGVEHRQVFEAEDSIVTLDWSPSPLSSNALAVVFEHFVDIIAPGRSTQEAQASPQWQRLARLDLRNCAPSKIGAACWLSSEQFVIASGAELLVYGPWLQSAWQDEEKTKTTHLAELVAEVGGPVAQYHPTFLLQCVIWGKMALAKALIGNLEKAVLACSPQEEAETWSFEDVALDIVLQDDSIAEKGTNRLAPPSRKNSHRSIFDEPQQTGDQDELDLFASDRIDNLAQRLQTIRPPHLLRSDLAVLVNLIKAISDAGREHRSLDASGLRYTLALRQLLNSATQAKQAAPASNFALGFRDYLWAFHSQNQETLLAAVESGYQNKLDWPAAKATGIFVWLQNRTSLQTQAEAIARAQFMSGEDRDPVKCSLIYFALGKRKVVQGLWRQAVWHPEQKKMLQFLSHDFDEERWKTAAQKNAFALLSQRRYEFAASFFMLGGSLRDAVNVCVRNLDDLQLAVALARIQESCDDGPVFTDLLKTRILPLAFETGDRWMGSWALWMLKRRDLAVRIIVTPLRDLLADEGVATLLRSSVTCGNDSNNDPALALLFQQLRTKSLQTIKGLNDIPEKKVFDFVLNTNRALCRMGCPSIGLSLLRNWQFEPPSASSASTLFHRVSKHDLETLSRVDEAVLAESADAFSELRLADQGVAGSREDTVSTSPTRHRRRSSQTVLSPPSSPTRILRRSSLLRRRSSIINDLDIGAPVTSAAQAGATRTPVVPPDADVAKSHSGDALKEAEAGMKQGGLTAEPDSVEEVNGSENAPTAKRVEAPAPKKQGISVFKTAAASNSQQGAQEFDFGSFGF